MDIGEEQNVSPLDETVLLHSWLAKMAANL
jgi:hypothetical protein